MAEPAETGGQAVADLSQGLGLGQLAEQHGQEVVPTGEPLAAALGTDIADQVVKLVAGKKLQKLAKQAGVTYHQSVLLAGVPWAGSHPHVATVGGLFLLRSEAVLDRSGAGRPRQRGPVVADHDQHSPNSLPPNARVGTQVWFPSVPGHDPASDPGSRCGRAGLDRRTRIRRRRPRPPHAPAQAAASRKWPAPCGPEPLQPTRATITFPIDAAGPATVRVFDACGRLESPRVTVVR